MKEGGMKSFFIILLLCCVHPLVFAQKPEIKMIDQQIVSLLYNGEWQKSDSLIELDIGKAPDQPKYHFLKIFNLFYSRFFSANALSRDSIIALVKYQTWKAISLGEKQEVTTENEFYLGCLYGFLCRANSMQQEYWLMYWNARKCQKYLEKVIKEDQTLEDAYLGLALIEYFPAVARIPWYTKALAWCGGMSGNRERGLEYFKRVAERGVLFQGEALFVLTIAYHYGESNLESAIGCWKELSNKYPKNIIFKNGYQRTKIVAAIYKQGAKFLETDYLNLKSEYALTSAVVLNGVGYELMNLNRYDDAFIVFNVNIKLFPDVANCYDSMAELYFNKNDFKNSTKYYHLAKDKLAVDTTVTAQFKEFLNNNIDLKLKELEGK
jgi:tetratricopeptide (TPR) repeat protein